MASLNKVMILGNLGKEPEVKWTLEKKAVATLSVATDVKWKDAAGKLQERTDWHRIVVWGKQAELCGEYLKKGDPALFEGRLQTRDYEKDGKKVYVTEVVATNVQFLPRAKNGAAVGEVPPEVVGGDAPGDDASIPF